MKEASGRRFAPGSLREIADVAWPIVVSMLSYTAMGVTDTLLVGWVGKMELAAVGIGTTAIYLVNSFLLGTLHGVKVVTAQATGGNKPDKAVVAAWQGALLAVPAGLLVVGLSLFSGPIFALLGGPPEVQAQAAEYFAVRVWAAPFWYVAIALNDYYQGTGDTRTPMRVNLVANGVNIVADVILIFGLGPIPALGIQGAAGGTVIACIVGFAMVVRYFLKDVSHRPVWRPKVAAEVLELGLPIGVRYALGVGGFTMFTAILARLGANHLAAHQVAIKIVSVSFLPGYGISEAATVLVGQYVGAGKRAVARASYASSMKLGVGIMGVMGLLFLVAPELLVRAFTNDAEVIAIASQLLRVGAIFQIFDAVAMVATGALNGTGDTRFTAAASVGASWFVMVPVAYVLAVPMELGAVGAWLGITAEIVVLAIILAARFNGRAWEKRALAHSRA
jgi:multidrug resistance protein, MATE family